MCYLLGKTEFFTLDLKQAAEALDISDLKQAEVLEVPYINFFAHSTQTESSGGPHS